MEPDYWQQRWAEGRTGWHQPEVNALLRRHWPALSLPPNSRVFVPLCGKSEDMAWLATQGHHVLGVELSRDACAAFFSEHGVAPEVSDHGRFRHFRGERMELLAGNAFDLDTQDLANCVACYDRAALVALPRAMRERYAEQVLCKLPEGCRLLLVTLEYPQSEKEGPPFGVDSHEVARLLAPHWRIAELERRDILAQEPRFQAEGVTRLETVAYRLEKLPGA